jgi:hypothetical protein
MNGIDRLRSGEWMCARCSEVHGWPYDLAAIAPGPWPHERVYAHNGMLRTEADFLSEDFCVLAERGYYFVRALMEIPVQGLAEPFGFGCWTTLSRANFDIYVEQFDTGSPPDQEPWWGWLSNGLADLTTEPLGVWVQPQPGRQRPLLTVASENHPLARAQRDGLTAEKMVEILAFYGHAPED